MMNTSLRHIIAVLMALVPLCLQAQGTSALDRMYETFSSSCYQMDCSYKMESDGIPIEGRCKVEFQGMFYRMSSGALEVVCDGESIWVMDSAAKEAVIEPVSDDVQSYMTNPALLFRDMDKVFSLTKEYAAGADRKYQLSARQDCGVESAVLLISSDAQLRKAEFTLDDGTVIRIDVLSGKALPLKERSEFVKTGFTSEWIVTDLR